MLRLLRLKAAKNPAAKPARPRVWSPSGAGSTFTTSAPRSASTSPAHGPHDGVAELEDPKPRQRGCRSPSCAAFRRKASRLPARTIRSAAGGRRCAPPCRPTSISASRSMPVAMPISSHSRTSSSVQILPAAPFCPAKGQPPRPPTVLSNWLTPSRSPAWALATARPRVSCRCRPIRMVGPSLAHRARSPRSMRDRRRPAHGVGERDIGDRDALPRRRSPGRPPGWHHLRRRDVALVVAAEGGHHADPRHRDAGLRCSAVCLRMASRFSAWPRLRFLREKASEAVERDRAGQGQPVPEGQRPLQPVRVEPQRRVIRRPASAGSPRRPPPHRPSPAPAGCSRTSRPGCGAGRSRPAPRSGAILSAVGSAPVRSGSPRAGLPRGCQLCGRSAMAGLPFGGWPDGDSGRGSAPAPLPDARAPGTNAPYRRKSHARRRPDQG